MSSATKLPTSPDVPFKASDHVDDGKSHVLLAATGSVATIKIPNIITALSKHTSVSIILLLTKSSSSFLGGQSPEQPFLSTLSAIPNVLHIFTDDDEWSTPWVRGNPILHIELRRWAGIMLIAPLSANSLAKVVGGWSDNLITSVVRAWDTTGEVDSDKAGKKKRILVAPAMNTAMWRHPITARQIRVLEGEWGMENGGWFDVLRPKEKVLACGDVGDGAMMEWGDIVEVVKDRVEAMRVYQEDSN